MTTIKPNFTILGRGIIPAIDVLKDRLSITDISDDDLRKVKSVRVVAGEFGDNKDYKLDNGILRIAMTKRNVIQDMKEKLDIEQAKTPERQLYVPQKTLQNEKAKLTDVPLVSLPPEQEKNQASLGFLSEILDRAYNRRTTVTSWVLYLVFKSFGLKKDDFEPMSEALKDAHFTKVFTEYREKAEGSQTDAKNYLKTAFEKKDSDEINPEAKQKLVTTASFLIDNYNKLNMGFVRNFPKVFCIQNIAMPFLKWAFPKIKLFDFMVFLNPWLYEVSENLGNYVGEIENIQKYKPDEEKVISEVNLTPLSYEEFSLQNIIKYIVSGFERIFGKESTLSSIIANKLLKKATKGGGFQAFAKDFTDDTTEGGFIRELYTGLDTHSKKSSSKVPEFKFKDDVKKSWGAKAIWGITSLARSIPEEKIKEFSNIFGGIFVPLNLAMPFLAKVFHKGFAGFLTHSLLKIFPILNELVFDILANFRKEVLDVQRETSDQSVANLFPEIKDKYKVFKTSLQYLYESVKEFASKKFSKKLATS